MREVTRYVYVSGGSVIEFLTCPDYQNILFKKITVPIMDQQRGTYGELPIITVFSTHYTEQQNINITNSCDFVITDDSGELAEGMRLAVDGPSNIEGGDRPLIEVPKLN